MIRIEGVSKYYGVKHALKEVSFQIPEGTILGLLGRNGAGKTTLMRIMTGTFPASSGKVYIGDYEIHADPMEVKRQLGYLPESPPLYIDMLVEEYLVFVARLKGVDETEVKDAVYWAMDITQITDRRRTLIDHLSKGYRQRVGLSAALVNRPKLVILDEPLVGLDPVQSSQMKEKILQISQDRTIIFSSHILPEVEELCQNIVILEQGEKIAEGTPDDVRQQFAQSETFHVRIRPDQTEKTITLIQKYDWVESVNVLRAGLLNFSTKKANIPVLSEITTKLDKEKIELIEIGRDELDFSKVFQRIASNLY